jgi:hypothetical protein
MVENHRRGRPKGYRCSLETRARISAAHKGKELSLETRARMSAAKKGKPGKPLSPEHRAKLSAVAKEREARKRLQFPMVKLANDGNIATLTLRGEITLPAAKTIALMFLLTASAHANYSCDDISPLVSSWKGEELRIPDSITSASVEQETCAEEAYS